MPDPSLNFGLPRRGVVNAPIQYNQAPLRAEGNLSYLDFINLLRYLWDRAHPDIPIYPTQGSNYAKYPCIVYGLELRKTFQDEPKPRYRDEHKVVDDDNVYLVTGQRFTNIVKFTVITRNEPELCEQIIETFEDFMFEHTKVFKQNGVSDVFYARRLPDDEGNRTAEDVCERAVSYMVILEKLHQITLDKLNEVIINARIFVENYGTRFYAVEGDSFITVPEHNFGVGDKVTIFAPKSNVNLLPPNLHHGWTYEISSVTANTITLVNFNGTEVDPGGEGTGRIYLNDYYPGQLDLEDLYQSATPSSS